MSTTTTNEKLYKLKTWDNWVFEVDESVAMMFALVRRLIRRGNSDNTIPLTHVSGPILSKVIEYCLKHIVVDSKKAAAADDDDSIVAVVKDELKEWDEAFIDVDQETLFEIILAASVQGIRGLFDLAYTKLLQT